jgi:hypothetical protein
MPRKPAFLKDFVDIPTFAKQIDRCEATIDRWTRKPNGLPFTKMGAVKLIHIPTAQQWLLDTMQHPNPRRKSETATA